MPIPENQNEQEISNNKWSLRDDRVFILNQTTSVWDSLKKAHLFITGGTGFIGRWLLEGLHHANRELQLDLSITLISRNSESFKKKCPHLCEDWQFTLIAGDVSAELPIGKYTHIIHAATDANADINEHQPLTVFKTIVQGTENILELARHLPESRTLFLGSGAVYGQQPDSLERISETWNGSPDPQSPRNAYAEAKRAAEMLCAIYHKQFAVNVTSARIFSLLGPFLPLDTHFAAGNFIRDAMAGKPVIVNGNGLPVRSYLYPVDLIIWLLHILAHGRPGMAYNVGSEHSISIGELAKTIAELIGNGRYEIRGAADRGWNNGRYVPNTDRSRKELGLAEYTSLETAILNTRLAARSYNP